MPRSRLPWKMFTYMFITLQNRMLYENTDGSQMYGMPQLSSYCLVLFFKCVYQLYAARMLVCYIVMSVFLFNKQYNTCWSLL